MDGFYKLEVLYSGADNKILKRASWNDYKSKMIVAVDVCLYFRVLIQTCIPVKWLLAINHFYGTEESLWDLQMPPEITTIVNYNEVIL